MSFRAFTRLLFLLATMTICTTVLHANQIVGSLALAGFNVTENGTNLRTMTTIMGTDALTSSAAGEGDFSIVPIKTDFGSFSLTSLSQ